MEISKKKKAIEEYENQLINQCGDMDEKRREIAKGICKVTAFSYIEALELMEDVLKNGWVEMFSQSDKAEPYERTRPTSDILMRLFEKYSKGIAQLNGMLPSSAVGIKTDDTLMSFIASRRD